MDIWQPHNKTRPEEVTDELLEALQVAKAAGKTRFVGVTSHLNVPAMLGHMLKRGGIDVMLCGYNFGGFARIENSEPRFEGSGSGLIKTLKQEGAMTAAIRWALSNEAVGSSAVSMSDFDQVKEDVRALSEPYSARDESLLGRKLAFLAPRYCRMCGACGGVCDKGDAVPDMLRFLTYAEGYGDFPLARQSYLELPASVRKIQCSDCSACTVRCPNGVQVRARLIRAQELFG